MLVAIVPAFNEAKNIGSVVRNLFHHVDKVVVINDGSYDSTSEIAEEAGAIVLYHKLNRGQGASLETGHCYARNIGADYVLHFDGDNQFDVNDIAPAIDSLKQHDADILFGSRFLGKKANLPAMKKYFILPFGRLVNRILCGIRLSDAHNGFRILNKKALDKIIITQDRMAHASEIISLAKNNGLSHVEFPVNVVYHEYGQKLKGGLEILKDLFFGGFVK